MRWILFVVRRYIRTRRKEKGHAAVILATLGIAAGITTLMTVLGVMNGFQATTINALLEVDSLHLRLHGAVAANPSAAEVAMSVKGVRTAYRVAEIQTLARGFSSQQRPCMVRAVPADLFLRDSALVPWIIPPRSSSIDDDSPTDGAPVVFEPQMIEDGGIMLGAQLASLLGVRPGDSINLMNLTGTSFNLLQPENLTFRVIGLIRTGYYEIDASWAFMNLETARPMINASEVPMLGIKLEDHYQDQRAAHRLKDVFSGHDIRLESWTEYNQAIFGALRMEKNVMFIIMCLVFLVIAGNIYQNLQRSVHERREDISMLRAMGAPITGIRLIFVAEGLGIGVAGCFFGFLFGWLVTGNINTIFSAAEQVSLFFATILNSLAGAAGYPAVSFFSPSYFYLLEVTALTYPGELIFLLCFILACTTAAGLLASRRAVSIKPAEVLRDE